MVVGLNESGASETSCIGMEKPNGDTAWKLAGKPFDVIGGSEFMIKIRATGAFPLQNPSGHKDMYKMCLYLRPGDWDTLHARES